MDTSSHSSKAGESVRLDSSIVNLYEDVVAALEAQPQQEEGSGSQERSGSQQPVFGSTCSSPCKTSASDHRLPQCSGGSSGATSSSGVSRDQRVSAAQEEYNKNGARSSPEAEDPGLAINKELPEEPEVGMASTSGTKTQEEEEKEALEEEQQHLRHSPDPCISPGGIADIDKDRLPQGSKSTPVEARTDRFWGAGFVLSCPRRIVGLVNTMRQRDQNKRKRRCLIYAVAIAGLCCLTLILGVVIWRCTWNTEGTSSSPGEAAGHLRQDQVETTLEGAGGGDGLLSATPSKSPSIQQPETGRVLGKTSIA